MGKQSRKSGLADVVPRQKTMEEFEKGMGDSWFESGAAFQKYVLDTPLSLSEIVRAGDHKTLKALYRCIKASLLGGC